MIPAVEVKLTKSRPVDDAAVFVPRVALATHRFENDGIWVPMRCSQAETDGKSSPTTVKDTVPAAAEPDAEGVPVAVVGVVPVAPAVGVVVVVEPAEDPGVEVDGV